MFHDVAVIGAGIAGASVAAELAAFGSRVVLLEGESQPGYHTTGRSAALYAQTYGNDTIRALTVGSRAAFDALGVLTPRGALMVGGADRRGAVEAAARHAAALVEGIEVLERDAVLARVPVLRPEAAACAMFEPHAMDIDVHALHQAFLRRAAAHGAERELDAHIDSLVREGDSGWVLGAGARQWRARVVVNAAGAWGDAVAALAGVAPVGLRPLRRTAIVIDAPAGLDSRHWPAVIDIDETWYFKPDAGALIASPADETESDPCDAQPETLDIAICVDRLQQATTLDIPRVRRSWAGLRSFVADRTPVVGFEPTAPGFFWLVGQGGYGIQTAPALGRLAAAWVRGEKMPQDLAALGATEAALSPARLR